MFINLFYKFYFMKKLSNNPMVWKFMFIIAVLITLVFAVSYYFQDLLSILIIGTIIIMITHKIGKIFKKSMDFLVISGSIRIIVRILFIISVLILLYYAISLQIAQISTLVQKPSNQTFTEKIIDDFDEYIPEFFGKKIIDEQSLTKLENLFFAKLYEMISKLSYFLFVGVLIIPLMFDLYYNKRVMIFDTITESIPKKYHDGFKRGLKDIISKLNDYFEAKALESFIVGTICCIGFYIAGIKGWFFLGIIAGFLNIVPYLGPVMGAILPMIIAYFNSFNVLMIVLITIIIAQLVDNFYLIPFMISGKVKIEPLLSLILIIIGSNIFGIFGMIFAIPIYMVYKIILRESYEELIKIYPSLNE